MVLKSISPSGGRLQAASVIFVFVAADFRMIAAPRMDAFAAVFFRAIAIGCDEAPGRRDDLKKKTPPKHEPRRRSLSNGRSD
jgi:hypothetical protein